jgi:hypothetical protein
MSGDSTQQTEKQQLDAQSVADRAVASIEKEQDDFEQFKITWAKAMEELKAFNEQLKKKYGLEITSFMQPTVTLRKATEE